MGTVLLITFLFPQFLEFLFRDVLQQVLLDIILGRQLEAVFAYEEILLSLIENVHIHVEMARYDAVYMRLTGGLREGSATYLLCLKPFVHRGFKVS